jgi:hypothetical protein
MFQASYCSSSDPTSAMLGRPQGTCIVSASMCFEDE